MEEHILKGNVSFVREKIGGFLVQKSEGQVALEGRELGRGGKGRTVGKTPKEKGRRGLRLGIYRTMKGYFRGSRGEFKGGAGVGRTIWERQKGE